MPYKDPDLRRRVNARSQARRRARLRRANGGTVVALSPPVGPDDELSIAWLGRIVVEEMGNVRACPDITAAERARCVAGLVTAGLRVVETDERGEVAEHLRALRAVVGR
jgi:hypothetical protein